MALAKTVIIHETGEVFHSMTEAADDFGVNVASLSLHINGKHILKCLKEKMLLQQRNILITVGG